jgi:hypothetical protein
MSYHNNSQNNDSKAFRSLLHSPLAAVVAAKRVSFLVDTRRGDGLNILFALQLNHAHSKVDAQPVVNEATSTALTIVLSAICLSTTTARKMPKSSNLISSILNKILCSSSYSGTDFKFMYVHVATRSSIRFYERAETFLQRSAGKFINTSPTVFGLYWDGPSELPLFNSDLGPWESGGTACYPSHKFIITKPHHPEDGFADLIL